MTTRTRRKQEEPMTETPTEPLYLQMLEAWTYNHRNTIKPMDRYNIGEDPVGFVSQVHTFYHNQIEQSELWTLAHAPAECIGGYRYVLMSYGCIVFCHSYMDYLKFRAEVPQTFGGV